jgi:hypothetical protein
VDTLEQVRVVIAEVLEEAVEVGRVGRLWRTLELKLEPLFADVGAEPRLDYSSDGLRAAARERWREGYQEWWVSQHAGAAETLDEARNRWVATAEDSATHGGEEGVLFEVLRENFQEAVDTFVITLGVGRFNSEQVWNKLHSQWAGGRAVWAADQAAQQAAASVAPAGHSHSSDAARRAAAQRALSARSSAVADAGRGWAESVQTKIKKVLADVHGQGRKGEP